MDGGGGRRRVAAKSSAEDQALDLIAKEVSIPQFIVIARNLNWDTAYKRGALGCARDVRCGYSDKMSDTQTKNSTPSAGSVDSLADILNNLNSDDERQNTEDECEDGIIESEIDSNKFKLTGVTEDGTNDSDTTDVRLSRKNSSVCFEEGNIINQFLNSCNDNAEARLLARRQARAEARDIRMRELERQQKEQEENADRQYDMIEQSHRTTRTTSNRFLSSRRSSEDSLEDGGSIREIRHELKEMEEKFRKAMIANAQLDNDKASQTYQLELLKDRLEELEEEFSQLRREHRDKCRDHDQLKRLSARLKDDLAVTRLELDERDRLIAEKGLVIVVEDTSFYEEEEKSDGTVNGICSTPKKSLVSAENAQLLENAGEGSLDVRLAKFALEKKDLQDQISHLRLELEEEKSRKRKTSGITLNGPTSDFDCDPDDVQRDVGRQLADYKFRAQKAEQDVATLQATVARLESQVIRYKSASEIYEKSEEALKQEKRKLQREISGIAILTVGAVIHALYHPYSQFVDPSFESAPILLIIVGVIVFIVAFFGCCGAVKENHCMIITFSAFLIIIFCLEMAAGIAGYVRRNDIEDMLDTHLNNTMHEYYNKADAKRSWDIMQHELKCCGMNGPSDWAEIIHNNSLPHTCCPPDVTESPCTTQYPDKYEKSCLTELKQALVKYGTIIGGVGVGIALVQLIGVVFACCLARSIRKEYETV
ncbi:hypothetical protein FQR65_LT06477 [Abscondita terminalis]|nr:hypothetical protein FQR65_LT06477 [Abscondita terminalis]